MKKITLLLLIIFSVAAANAQYINAHLLACYPLDGSFTDMSSHGVVAHGSGGTYVTDRNGHSASALHFNGTTEHYIIDTLKRVCPSSQWTLSFWAKTDEAVSNIPFFTQPDVQSDRIALHINYLGGSPTRMIYDYGDIFHGGRYGFDSEPFDTNWHHYAFVIDSAGNRKTAYIDGHAVIDNVLNAVVHNKFQPLWIGGGYDPGSIPNFYKGALDDIRFYDLALDSVRVDSVMHAADCELAEAGPTGIQNVNSSAIGIFPNPSQGLLEISLPEQHAALSADLMSLEGQVLQKVMIAKDVEKFSLQVRSDLSNGTYILHCYGDGLNINSEIILQR
jgi:Concanavalin A-like lectin/glucanases superfamily